MVVMNFGALLLRTFWYAGLPCLDGDLGCGVENGEHACNLGLICFSR